MGKGIKTRVSDKKGIKAIDKAAVASERMKEAYIRTKDKADHSLYAEEGSPGEYASDRLSAGVDNVTHEAVHQLINRAAGGFRRLRRTSPRSRRKSKSGKPQPNSRKTSGSAGWAVHHTLEWPSGSRYGFRAGQGGPSGARGHQDPGPRQERH
mgnify:CR=1 FL=1